MIAPPDFASPATTPPQVVLIVDDDEDSRLIYEHFLVRAGYTVTRASSAIEALSVARRSRPNAVLLDLVLPDLHGSELAPMLRSVPGLERVALVGITARVTQAILDAPELMNVPRLLIKPTTGAQLVEAVRLSLAEGQ